MTLDNEDSFGKGECPRDEKSIPLNNYMNGKIVYDTLHSKADRVIAMFTLNLFN